MEPGMRRCIRCEEESAVENFPFKNKSTGLRHSWCSGCLALNSAKSREAREAEWLTAEAAGELHIRTRRCCTCKADKPLQGNFSKRTAMCRRCSRIRGRELMRTTDGRYSQARNIAKRRGLGFELTKTQYIVIISQPCVYCSAPLNETGGGIDRIDNTGSYCPGNVVPCCGVCNNLKCSLFTFDEMRLLGAVVKEIRERRAQNYQEPLDSHAHSRRRRMSDDE